MPSPVAPKDAIDSADPFLVKLRNLRTSLRAEASELRYRLEELERRLLGPSTCSEQFLDPV
jgi:hypothetical protein